MTKYRITGYGDTIDFDTLEEAQATVRACGGDFSSVTLAVRHPDIIDESGEVVGQVVAEDE
jgi:hypothetical protein